MTRPVTLPNVFANLGGSQPASTLDANFTALQSAVNDPASQGNYGADTGIANAYAVTYSPAVTVLTDGLPLSFRTANANTGASTLNPNALGAKSIVRPGGGALQTGDIPANTVVTVVYNSALAAFVLQSAFTPFINGPKNRIINGSAEIWQRGTSIPVTASSNGYGADRFVLTTGVNQASTISQVAGLTTTSQWAAKVQRNNAQTGTTAMVYEQPFELNNIYPLRGQTVTVSFTASAGANWSPTNGTLTCILATGTGAAARRGTVAYTTEATPVSFSQNLTTTPTRYTGTSTTIATNATQLTLYWTWTPVGTAGADDSFTLDDVQIEFGSSASAFELPDFEVELAKCQRYFCKTFAQATAPAQNVGVNTGEYTWGAVNAGAAANPSFSRYMFPVTMRTTPSVTTFNPANTNAQARDENAAADLSATTAAQVTDGGLRITATGNGGTVVNDLIGVHLTASAEL